MSKLDQAVAYVVRAFAQRQLGPLTRTKLVKYLYLADLAAATAGHRPITGVTYKSYYFGPYAPEILRSAEAQTSHVRRSALRRSDGAPYYTYEPGPVTPRFTELSARERQTLDEVLDEYGRLSLRELLQKVYGTKPYRSAQMMDPIRLT
jgi:uncharacterized phage-associated protein